MDLAALRNPVLEQPGHSLRDPAAIQVAGAFHLFFTVFSERRMTWHVGACATLDFRLFTPLHLISSEGFASPGNVISVGGEWWLCVQSYRLTDAERAAGRRYPGDDCRLYWLRSSDLVHWSEPEPLEPAGCRSAWARSPRQIDPYVLATDDGWYLFFKTDGALGLWHSDDLHTWTDLTPTAPLLSAADVACGTSIENPCVVHDGTCYRLYYSPCREGRGLCEAVSPDLRRWTDLGDIPAVTPWAAGGPTAHFVMRHDRLPGGWLMLFHGEHCDPSQPTADAAALGIAWSADLEDWHFPPARTV